MGKFRSHTVEVEIYLEDFETSELVEELQSRGALPNENFEPEAVIMLLTEIYEKRILAKEYQRELDELIWRVIGRIS